MLCTHPLGFTRHIAGQLFCFDCGTPCPGKCVCDAPYRSMQCQSRGHLHGPRLVEASKGVEA